MIVKVKSREVTALRKSSQKKIRAVEGRTLSKAKAGGKTRLRRPGG